MRVRNHLLICIGLMCGSAMAGGQATQAAPELVLGSRVPQWPLKTSRTLISDQQMAQARALCESDEQARRVRETIIEQAAYWIGKTDEQLREVLPDARVPRAFNASTQDCPVHGKEIYKFGTYPWKLDREQPFTVICPIDGARYPSNDFEAFYRSGMKDRSLLTGDYPDDGRGWVSPSGEKYWLVGYACHWNWLNTWIPAVTTLSQAYVLTGEKVYAQKALAMLDRIAEVYPGMDHAHQSRYGELTGGSYQGKIVNHIWETGVLRSLATAYDLVFDALVAEDPVALPWRGTEAIRANIEANLLEEGIDSVAAGKISGNFGMHQSALAKTVIVRQNGPTVELLEGILRNTGGKFTHEGIDYALYNLVFKDGMPYESSPGYCFGWVNHLLGIADSLKGSELSLFEHPKMRRMLDGPLDLICAGRFTPAVGDAGSVNADHIGVSAGAYETAYRQYGEPRYAWLAQELGGLKPGRIRGFTDLFTEKLSEDAKLAAAKYKHNPPSRLLDGYGMAVLNNRKDSAAAAMYYGLRGGHGHYDRLNIELFAHGRRVSPDLGYPDFMNAFVPGIYTWTKNTISHNCVVIDRQRQSRNFPAKVLRFHRGNWVQVVDVDAAGTYPQGDVYRRTLVLVETDADNCYLVDVFRVKGGKEHVLSLHGNEGEFTLHGAVLPPPVTEGTLAGPQVQYGQIHDDSVLGKPGYKGSFGGYNGSGYQHFFNWQQSRADGDVVGEWKLKGDPLACLRAHLLGSAGQEITVADAYVSPTRKVPTVLKYMLAARAAGESGNTFVTVWEPAGATPFIDRAERETQDDGSAPGCDQRVRLDVQRGKYTDSILIAPQPGEPGAVVVATLEEGKVVRAFAAGAGEQSAGAKSWDIAAPATITGQIISADYREPSVRVKLEPTSEGHLGDPQALIGLMARIHNHDHSCMYPIKHARLEQEELVLELNAADVFTGRMRVDLVSPDERTVKTATYLLHEQAMPGMRLVTADLGSSALIVSARKGVVQLADTADLQAFKSAPEGADAWVVDFGPGDRVEIERFAEK